MIYPTELAGQAGPCDVFDTVLTGSDVLQVDLRRLQLLVLRNPSGAGATVRLVGDAALALDVRGYGTVDLTSGFGIAVPAGATVALVLDAAGAFAVGTVRLTGGAGVIAQFLQLAGPRSWEDNNRAELIDSAIAAMPEA